MSHWPLAFKRDTAVKIQNIGELKRVARGDISFWDKRNYSISTLTSKDASWTKFIGWSVCFQFLNCLANYLDILLGAVGLSPSFKRHSQIDLCFRAAPVTEETGHFRSGRLERNPTWSTTFAGHHGCRTLKVVSNLAGRWYFENSDS